MFESEFIVFENFPRLKRLPAYILSAINQKKQELRKKGVDVIDLGMGNPNIPAPPQVVNKIKEAVEDPRNHRYSITYGLPKLREEIAKRYKNVWNVELDPESEVVSVNGTKMGFFQLMFAILSQGDTVLVPEPAYPAHLYAPIIAGADVRTFPMNGDFFGNLEKVLKTTYPKPKAIVISFPNNPTTKCVDLEFFRKIVDFAISEGIWLIHDFAYADIVFDGYEAPSILQIKEAKKIAIEFYSMSKGFCMAGFRIGFALGNPTLISALSKIKSWMEYGVFQPIQISAIIAMREAADYPKKVAQIYQKRRDAVVSWLKKIGWEIEAPQGSMFVWAKIPQDFQKLGSIKFSELLLEKAEVAVAPGVAFGQSGEGYIRIALVENENRIKQAMRNIRRFTENGKI
jgi:alanine-synthesizing transaminase